MNSYLFKESFSLYSLRSYENTFTFQITLFRFEKEEKYTEEQTYEVQTSKR